MTPERRAELVERVARAIDAQLSSLPSTWRRCLVPAEAAVDALAPELDGCPNVVTSDEGTSYCSLAEERLRDVERVSAALKVDGPAFVQAQLDTLRRRLYRLSRGESADPDADAMTAVLRLAYFFGPVTFRSVGGHDSYEQVTVGGTVLEGTWETVRDALVRMDARQEASLAGSAPRPDETEGSEGRK